MVAISVWHDTPIKVQNWISNYQSKWTFLLGNQSVMTDYEVTATPTNVLIDKEGIIRYTLAATLSYDAVAFELDKVIALG